MDYVTHGASAMPGWTPTIKKLVSLDLGFNCSSAEPGKVGMMVRRVRSQLLPNPGEGGKGAGVLQLLSGKHLVKVLHTAQAGYLYNSISHP